MSGGGGGGGGGLEMGVRGGGGGGRVWGAVGVGGGGGGGVVGGGVPGSRATLEESGSLSGCALDTRCSIPAMPTLPVIDDVYRITLNWSGDAGVTPRNVIHVLAPSSNEPDVGGAVVAALQPHQFEGMSQNQVLDTVTVLALDGASAGVDVDGGGYNSEGGAGDPIPALAAVVSFRTHARGPRGRGRIFIGPLVESISTAGEIPGANATEIAQAWVDFQTALQAGDPSCQHVVASYVHAEANPITSYRCDAVAGTQIRRQHQLR